MDEKLAEGTSQPTAPPRRRLLDRILLIGTKEDAKLYKDGEKWLFTAIVSLAAAVAPLGSAMLMLSGTVANLSVALYALSMAIIPLWWSVLSEAYGRRPIYLVSFTLFLVWNSVAAVSTSIEMFIIMRFLAGGASASVAAVGAGTVADLWEVKRRGTAMGYFFLGPMLGPLVSPIIGGILTQRFGWRSTQWGAVVYGGLVWLSMIFLLPETSSKAVKGKEPAVAENSEGGNVQPVPESCVSRFFKALGRMLVEPFRLVGYLRSPPLFMTCYYASISFACYYILNLAIQRTFSRDPYSFRAIILGLLYIPSALGSIVASVVGGRWTDYVMRREAKAAGRFDESGNPKFRPSDRMCENAWIPAFVFPAALLVFGWTTHEGIFWFAPIVVTFFFGLGNSLIFNTATTMLTEILPGKASNAVALNNLMRNTLSCAAAVATDPLLGAIGTQWLFTGLAVICWASSGVIWALKRHSDKAPSA
ncbi:Quinidine resistance protein 3 [Beauveria bassiana D1-5]|uniref:Quinidine resistance protein 3 n=1 Tax=Beauveria bassiana D1-5 TaxID=1245745 RepID=A0A0A2VKL6_BEABA|nr:Quinidine resistance protein 3 [Beauveria bassiana D1-5]